MNNNSEAPLPPIWATSQILIDNPISIKSGSLRRKVKSRCLLDLIESSKQRDSFSTNKVVTATQLNL